MKINKLIKLFIITFLLIFIVFNSYCFASNETLNLCAKADILIEAKSRKNFIFNKR